jgi:hypothetical protein
MKPAYKELNRAKKLGRKSRSAFNKGNTFLMDVFAIRQEHYIRKFNKRLEKIRCPK